MKNQAIIFILKNNEIFLTENINQILELQKEFDLYFVSRLSQDRTNKILKFNNLLNIELTYDPGYYEALKTGFEFISPLKYSLVIEFGEIEKIDLNEIKRLNDVNKEYNFQNSIVFASRYKNIKSKKKKKLFIYLLLKIKIVDPYSRFKIYNKSSLSYIKEAFQYNMYPQNLIYLLYKRPNFIDVKTKYEYKKQKPIDFKKQFIRKCRFNLYVFFILPFIMKKQWKSSF